MKKFIKKISNRNKKEFFPNKLEKTLLLAGVGFGSTVDGVVPSPSDPLPFAETNIVFVSQEKLHVMNFFLSLMGFKSYSAV